MRTGGGRGAPLGSFGVHAITAALLLSAGLLLWPAPAAANAPAPWWACKGRQVGQTCDPYGGGSGICEQLPNCEDHEEAADVDSCVVCRRTSAASCLGCATAPPGDGAGGLLLLVTGAGGLLGALLVTAPRRRRGARPAAR